MKERQNLLLGSVIILLLSYIFYDSYFRGEVTPPREKAVSQVKPLKYKVYTFDIPEDLNFAGEPVPVHNPDIRERFDREVHVNTYWNSSTVFMIKRANRWFPIIEPILQENGIPEDFKYLAVIESSLTNAVSPKKAVGFWQLLGGTAKEWGLEVNNEVDERYHPAKSAEVACRYVKKAYRKLGSWTSAAASYNMGVYGLSKRFKEQKVDSYYDLLLNHETARYVFRALALKEIMENPERYGYEIPQEHLYHHIPLKEIKITKTIPSLVDFSNSLGINYKTLKLHNPWLRAKQLTVRGRKDGYIIAIPESVSDDLIAQYQNQKILYTGDLALSEEKDEQAGSPKDLQSLNTRPE
ncbi:MAG: lytic transglycosylase domain-containing protein [Cytophagales bacterium]|nr:lytic transglycosylase domain-containing protein [Cytophagales bacterium]